MAASDQRVALNDAATRLQGVQAAAQTLTQRKAVLDGLAAKYTPYITEAAGTHNEAEWAGACAGHRRYRRGA